MCHSPRRQLNKRQFADTYVALEQWEGVNIFVFILFLLLFFTMCTTHVLCGPRDIDSGVISWDYYLYRYSSLWLWILSVEDTCANTIIKTTQKAKIAYRGFNPRQQQWVSGRLDEKLIPHSLVGMWVRTGSTQKATHSVQQQNKLHEVRKWHNTAGWKPCCRSRLKYAWQRQWVALVRSIYSLTACRWQESRCDGRRSFQWPWKNGLVFPATCWMAKLLEK